MSKNTVELIRAHLQSNVEIADEYFGKIVENTFSDQFSDNGRYDSGIDIITEGLGQFIKPPLTLKQTGGSLPKG